LVVALIAFVALSVWRLWFAPVPPSVVLVRGEVMGTTYTVKVVADRREEQTAEAKVALHATVQEALDAVDDSMSTYDAESELSKFNDGPAGRDVQLSPALGEVVALALSIGARSQGAFDVTVGPLVDRWGFGKPRTDHLPDDAQIEALREITGHAHLSFDPERPALRKDDPRVRVDLSAIAKGYGVDETAAALHEAGWDDFMVEVGGEIRVSGQTEAGRPWRLAVEKPSPQERAIYQVVELSEGALATSGDYRNFTVIEGTRVSHTIDPTTGRPVTHALASVSVVAPTCAEADALATALNVLGPQRGLALARAQELPALFLVGEPDSLEAHATDAWTKIRVK